MNITISVATALLDLVAPPRCINCALEGTRFCHECRFSLTSFVQRCIVCNEINARGSTCFSCRDDTLLSGIVSAGPYAHTGLRRSIGWLKFKSIRSVAPVLAQLLIPKLIYIAPLEILAKHAALIPIPLHTRRQRQRGFNQSEDIAQEITRFTDIPTLPLLTRPKATWAQAKLPIELRQQNSENAFQVEVSSKRLEGIKYYILVDDVVTTGTTLSSAATTLQSHIPKTSKLWAATIARG